jgi:hypothetical protein
MRLKKGAYNYLDHYRICTEVIYPKLENMYINNKALNDKNSNKGKKLVIDYAQARLSQPFFYTFDENAWINWDAIEIETDYTLPEKPKHEKPENFVPIKINNRIVEQKIQEIRNIVENKWIQIGEIGYFLGGLYSAGFIDMKEDEILNQMYSAVEENTNIQKKSMHLLQCEVSFENGKEKPLYDFKSEELILEDVKKIDEAIDELEDKIKNIDLRSGTIEQRLEQKHEKDKLLLTLNELKKEKLDKKEAIEILKSKNIEKVRKNYIEQLKRYIRINDDFFKYGKTKDINGKIREILIPKRKDMISIDFRLKDFEPIDYIKRYESRTTDANNIEYQKDIQFGDGIYFNQYSEMYFKPEKGNWSSIKKMLIHIFGETYLEFILDYFKILYCYPTQKLPIIALVSKEAATGKSTFLDFMDTMFGKNAVRISSSNLSSDFNAVYADKLIITIDETFIEKKIIQERVKSLVTAPHLTVNEKYQTNYTLPFIGKLIMASNNEDNFVQSSDSESRYAVFKLKKPKDEEFDYAIKYKLYKEIPAFLDYLIERELFYKEESRLYFNEDVYMTEANMNLKEESRPTLFKELRERLNDYFETTEEDFIYFTPMEISQNMFKGKYDMNYVRKVLKSEFHLEPIREKIRYVPFYRNVKYSKNVAFFGTDESIERTFLYKVKRADVKINGMV